MMPHEWMDRAESAESALAALRGECDALRAERATMLEIHQEDFDAVEREHARAVEALREVAKGGHHEGACLNYEGQDEMDYHDDDSCYRHIDAAHERYLRARAFLAEQGDTDKFAEQYARAEQAEAVRDALREVVEALAAVPMNADCRQHDALTGRARAVLAQVSDEEAR